MNFKFPPPQLKEDKRGKVAGKFHPRTDHEGPGPEGGVQV